MMDRESVKVMYDAGSGVSQCTLSFIFDSRMHVLYHNAILAPRFRPTSRCSLFQFTVLQDLASAVGVGRLSLVCCFLIVNILLQGPDLRM